MEGILRGAHHRQRPLLRDSEPSSAAPPPLPLRPGDGPRGRSPVPGVPRRPPGAAESAPPGPTRRQRKWRRPTAASTPRARHGAAHVGLPFPTAPPSLPLLFPPPSRRVAAPPCATHGTAAGGGSSFVRIEHQRAPCVFALPPSLHPTSRGHGAAREPVQESEAEQQGAELGERAGRWACGGVGRGEEGDVAKAPRRCGGQAGGCRAPQREGWGEPRASRTVTRAAARSLRRHRRGLPPGEHRPAPGSPGCLCGGAGGFVPAAFSASTLLPAMWEKAELRRRCTVWAFIQLGWPGLRFFVCWVFCGKLSRQGLEKT